MVWSYVPVVTTKDEVRLLIGDTNDAEQLLQDEEINFYLTQEGTSLRAAVACCEALMGRFGSTADYVVPREMEEIASQKFDHFQTLCEQLRRKSRRRLIKPFFGGASHSQKQTERENADRIEFPFRSDGETEPGTEQSDNPPEPNPPIVF